ncbi:hypothetical protein HCU64_20705 [Methylobacterium sp. C25]|uniref:hypothetical protein n=1 Tax=Methylobacterium sp. C25 TaxID=2721622 RepID=UPI001F29193A|nr:hypothetical protein [Methylobacterium sp. C25]MCE4226177.1 hypothetical protein [Methylobacterium sp. C25]
MNASNILPRGRGRREAEPARDHSVLIVVILMMTLVFAPVIGFHLAMPASDTHDQVAPSTNLVVAAPTKEPG